jgi:hypothetical protein
MARSHKEWSVISRTARIMVSTETLPHNRFQTSEHKSVNLQCLCQGQEVEAGADRRCQHFSNFLKPIDHNLATIEKHTN